jgi:hypothetical protein
MSLKQVLKDDRMNGANSVAGASTKKVWSSVIQNQLERERRPKHVDAVCATLASGTFACSAHGK